MWLHTDGLRTLGFARCSESYWKCEGQYGLPARSHLSVYVWGPPPRRRRAPPIPIEVSSFHVTLPAGGEVVHFYYREGPGRTWFAEGHTPTSQIRDLGADPIALGRLADAVAAELVRAFGGTMGGRDPPAHGTPMAYGPTSRSSMSKTSMPWGRPGCPS